MAQTSNASEGFVYGEVYTAAIKGEGEFDTLRKFCSQYPKAQINASGDTVFHILAQNSHANVFTELLQKLPLHDLMMMRNVDGDTALHEAARVGSLDIASLMLRKEANLITARNKLGETPIFAAAAYGQKKMLQFFSEETGCENGLRKNDGSTILHAAVMGEFYELALIIMELFPDLALARNDMGITALHLLAQSPWSFKSGTVYSWVNLGSSPIIPLVALGIIMYTYVYIPTDGFFKEDSENPRDGNVGIHGQSQNLPQKMRMRQLPMIRTIFKCVPWLRGIVELKEKHTYALEVVKRLVEIQSKQSRLEYYYVNHCEDLDHTSSSCLQWNKYKVLSGKNNNEDPLLQATKYGIIEIIQEILKKFPDAIEVRDRIGRNIFHMVAEYRQDQIFGVLKSMNQPAMKKMLFEVDKEGNTPLHLAAKYGFYQKRHVLPVLHQMPWELFWFKQVGSSSPSQAYHLQNDQGKTPKEVFDETHKDPFRQSTEWVKDNTGVTLVVATLIITLMFTAALTVPGGFEKGLPALLSAKNIHNSAKNFHNYFTLVALSLFFALASIVLSIYLQWTHFQQEDFYISLPMKFLSGNLTLLLCAGFTFASYIFTRLLESSEERFDKGSLIFGNILSILAVLMLFFVNIDVVFPLSRYLIHVLILRRSFSPFHN